MGPQVDTGMNDHGGEAALSILWLVEAIPEALLLSRAEPRGQLQRVLHREQRGARGRLAWAGQFLLQEPADITGAQENLGPFAHSLPLLQQLFSPQWGEGTQVRDDS